ncbi:hypothetical protein CLV24_12915 [Pontibacter ummariensis]|uniref:Uncharacterized protein n=1 Tax=Pontibacter ummariensis TaxID=1610492 RepID=A0A239KMI9_9BACT|nr:hypothetical protein [Pontibacter ummariensis]PRY05698.1 hypothetical protein CLV24_12915 [Pontibacter ummariensis]SNT18384.1 hypothetical protein SAMN06296052_12943 [Pontibacter ummariensis]
MERDSRYYDRDYRNRDYSDEFNEQLYNNDNRYNNYNSTNDYSRSNSYNNSSRGGDLDTYRSRYSSGGNYYGMRDENAAYRNVRSTGRTDFGSSGPAVGGAGGRGGYSGSNRNENEDHYRYGDPNPYMGYDRNGGYERTRGTGWRSSDDSASSDRDGFTREDSNYENGRRGRRFESLGRSRSSYDSDQGKRTWHPNDRRSYNIGTEDQYFDRSAWDHTRWDNNFDPSDSNRYSGRYQSDDDTDREDYRYSGRIQDVDREDNYATGLYSNNRSYLSDQENSDGDRYSRRERRDDRSGPDYSYRSPIRSYGRGEYRG